MHFHPLFINWENQKITVIGGGKIATRKITSLLDTGAKIRIISPSLTDRLVELVHAGSIAWTKDIYKPVHCQDTFFLIAATDNKELNRNILQDAKVFHIPLSLNISAHEKGNTIMPAILKHEGFQLAISSNGENPSAAKQFKEKLGEILNKNAIQEINS